MDTRRDTRRNAKARHKRLPGGGKVGRFYLTFLLLGFVGLAIVLRLVYVQVLEAPELRQLARQSRRPSQALYNRGRILDRNGVILAQDTLLYDLFAHPRYYWKARPDQIATVLAPILNLPEGSLAQRLSQKLSTIRIASDLPRAVMDQILAGRITLFSRDEHGNRLARQVQIPGLDFARKTVRNYPQGGLASHVLGYVNDDAGISSGVEWSARRILKKRPEDMVEAELDGRGRLIHLERLDPKAIVSLPKADDVTLTLDSRLQYVAERELEAGVKRTGGKRGTVILMRPNTGELLAFAVWPKYEPDQFRRIPPQLLKNWAITDVYPPGSTMKILTVACGLETGVIREDTRILDTGRMRIGGWTIQNADYHRMPNPGLIDLTTLFQRSSNIASAKVSMMIPPEKHRDLLQRFGIGSRTGVDLPGESRGILLPLPEWSTTTHATIGYGYGLASTPLQMAAAIAAIANGGIWNQPYLVQNHHQPVRRRVVSKETAALVTRLLSNSIETAKTSTVRLTGIRIAGKTGTSRRPNEDGRGYGPLPYTSFVGFFPVEDPQVLIMVVVDSPSTGAAWGSTVAGPIFKAIAEATLGYLKIKPATMSSASASGSQPAP